MNGKFVKLKTPFSAHYISDQKVRTVVVRSVRKVYFWPKILGKNTSVRSVQKLRFWPNSEMNKIFDHYCSIKMLCQKRSEQLWSEVEKKVYFSFLTKNFGRKYLGQKCIKIAFLTKCNSQKCPKNFTTTVGSKCCVKL